LKGHGFQPCRTTSKKNQWALAPEGKPQDLHQFPNQF
jgi:hypothetical protein